MSQDIKIPELGENISSGTVAKILVKVGERVGKGQTLLELETDKAVLEVPSPLEGTIEDILIKSGMTVKVGQAAFKIAGSPMPQTATPAKPRSEEHTSELQSQR